MQAASPLPLESKSKAEVCPLTVCTNEREAGKAVES